MAKFNSKRIQILILSESSLKCQTLIRRYFSVWEDTLVETYATTQRKCEGKPVIKECQHTFF